MGEYKRKFGIYAAWNYELEVEELNKMSEQGWQLVKGGLFSNKFKKNQEVQYRYQLDFQPSIEEKGRYLETFREQGWEYVDSTFNGWHYFRKLYDACQSEEQYEIFTDTASMREMNNRWAIVGMVLATLLVVYLAIQILYMIICPILPRMINILYLGFVLAVFIRGVVIMKNTGKRKNAKFDKWLTPVLFVGIILGPIVVTSMMENRPRYIFMNMTAEYYEAIPKEVEESRAWTVFEVKYPDNYYLDLMIDAETPICVSFVNENGEVAYTVTTAEFEEEDIRLWLPKGAYSMYFSDFAGGRISASASIE